MTKEQFKQNVKTSQGKLDLDLIMTENYYPVNITMVKYLGIEATLFFSAYYEQMEFMHADLTKYNTFSVRMAMERTGLSALKQKKAIEVLKSHNLIETYVQPGYPKVRKIKCNLVHVEYLRKKLEEFEFADYRKTSLAKVQFKEKINNEKKKFFDELELKAEREYYADLELEKWAEEQMLAEQKNIDEWVAAHPGEDYYEAHRIQTDACYAAPPTQPARSFNGFTF